MYPPSVSCAGTCLSLIFAVQIDRHPRKQCCVNFWKLVCNAWIFFDGSSRELFYLFKLAHINAVAVSLQAFDGFGAVRNCFHYFVGIGNGRICDIFVLELCRVGESLAACCFDMTCMSSIMLWGCCNEPSIY